MRLTDLTPSERRTAILLMLAAVFNGVLISLNQTQDIIARKALHAMDWQLMVMSMLWPVTNFFSVWWGKVFENSRHKQRYFLVAGIFGRLILVAAIWISTMNEYLVLLGLLFSSNSLIIPAQNSIYQKNIDSTRRAKIFGYTVSIGVGVSILITFIAGRILDLRESSYHLILFGTGICGFISAVVLSTIRLREAPVANQSNGLSWKQNILEPVTGTLRLLKENKGFAAFERSFSIYGMGFIMMQPIIPIYLVDKLHLSYTTNFLAKGIVAQLGMLLLSPMIGKLHDRQHPFRFLSVAFAMLMGFPILIVVSALLQGISVLPVVMVFAAYLVFGIAMTAVNISWNMGSIFFAGDRDASVYQSVHITLTGVRGLIAPALGFALLKVFNINAVFIVAAGFFCAASLVSWRDFRKLQAARLDSQTDAVYTDSSFPE
jgi:MFS family permease